MIAFFLSPVGRYVAKAIGVILLAWLLAWGAVAYIEGRGEARAIAKIEAANKASESKSDKAERDVLNCPVGKWNREAAKCER